MPRAQQHCDQLLDRMRSYGSLSERSPGNIGDIFSGRSAGTYRAEVGDAVAAMPKSIGNDGEPTASTALLGQDANSTGE
eukprot:4994011-Pyramimonas_sp.AAC.2